MRDLVPSVFVEWISAIDHRFVRLSKPRHEIGIAYARLGQAEVLSPHLAKHLQSKARRGSLLEATLEGNSLYGFKAGR